MWITSDEFNFVNACTMIGATAASQTTCEFSAVIDMGRYQSMVGIVTVGNNVVTTSHLFVQEASTSSTTLAAETAISAWNYRYGSTGADALSARAAGTSGGVTMSSTAGTIYLVEVKSDDLDAGYPYCCVSVSSASANRPVGITYVLKPRYLQNDMSQVTAFT